MASGLRLGSVQPNTVAGAAEFQRFLLGYPELVVQDIRQELVDGADLMVEAIKERAPASTLEPHPGALRESVHREDGGHDLSVVIVEDAADAQGRPYAAYVEFGHKGPGGVQVAGRKHFWPVIKEGRRQLLSHIRRRMNERAKGGA